MNVNFDHPFNHKYRVVNYSASTMGRDGPKERQLQDKLNSLTQDGWETVSVLPAHGGLNFSDFLIVCRKLEN